MPPRLRKATEAWHVARVSLHRGLEKPWREPVKEKLGLPWRPQDVQKCQSHRNCRLHALPAQEREVTVKKAERSWRSEEHFDNRHRDAERGVSPSSDVQSCFGPVCYAPSLWNVHSAGSMLSAFFSLVLQRLTMVRLP